MQRNRDAVRKKETSIADSKKIVKRKKRREIVKRKIFELLMGRRLEKNYLFCEPCFLSLFRPLFVRYIYRKYPTYISDKLCSKSDQKTRAK